ncbi:hypothetical protein ACQUW5_02655 [Legionella sp. CNM-1927-20]|uniref:hypothetical protein n=1 Tax=Legionella sp. CNM-1927-20 TaxID=3422221 RepID=UPI00403A9B16
MNISELLNKIAKLKEALKEYNEDAELKLNLNNLEEQSPTKVDFGCKPVHAEECREQIDLLQHYLSEFKGVQASLKNHKSKEPLDAEAYVRIIGAKIQLEKWITEILTEINAAITILQREERKFLAEKQKKQINTSFQQLQEARRLELPATLDESRCLEQYNSDVERLERKGHQHIEEIIGDPNIILGKASGKYSNALNILNLKAEQRRKFLLEAQENLVKYQQEFKENSGLYVSTSKVPKEQLKQYLESDKRSESFNKWFDDYYTRAKAIEGSTWSWLSEKAKYYTTFFSTAEADEDWYFLAELVDEKLSQISAELKVQIDGETLTSAPENLAENNLYNLQQKYQTINQLKQQETEQLAKWEKENAPVMQKAAKAKLFTQLASARNQQEIIEDNIYTLDNKYAEVISKVSADLQAIVEPVLSNEDQTQLELDQAQQAIEAIDLEALLASSSHYRNPSCNALEQKVDGQFATQEHICNKEIGKLTRNIINLPEDLAQFKETTQEHFNTLNDLREKLQETKRQLRKIVSMLQRLTSVQLELFSLKKQLAYLKVEDNQGRHKLFTQIIEVQSQLQELEVREAHGFKHPTSRAKLKEVKTLASLVNEAKTAHQEGLLTNIELSLYDLNNKARLLSTVSAQERSDFIKEIKEELDNIKETLQTTFTTSDEREVQDKKAVIEQKIKNFEQLAETVIPMLNETEAILRDYTKLIEQAKALTEEPQFAPRFELGRDISQLGKDAKPLLEKAKSLSKDMAYAKPLYEVITQIDTAQNQLSEIKKTWAEKADKDRIGFLNGLTKEVEEDYRRLIDSHKTLSPLDPTKRFYENTGRARFYENIVACEQRVLLEKLKAWQAKVNLSSLEENDYIKEIKESSLRTNKYKVQLLEILLADMDAGYKALLEKCKMYSLPSFKFYTKDKTKLAHEIRAFKKSHLFKAYQALAGESPFSIEAFKKYEEQLSFFTVPKISELPHFTHQVREEAANKYFGSDKDLGIFNTYLTQRHQSFWFKDFMGTMAACFLGVRFKSEQEKRKDYINRLKTTYQEYKNDVTRYDYLIKLIDGGLKQFKPRVKESEAGYEKTLQSYLQRFKCTVETIHDQNTLAADKLKLSVGVN